MEISKIREMILEAEAEETRTGDLVNLLQAIAERRGCNPNPSELENAACFVAEYINQVPVYMEDALLAAREAGIEPEMIRVLQAAETYWADPYDVIPDRMGLVGIMDDAYTSMCLLERMSERLQEKTGQSLFSQDLKPANSAIRVIIGEPYATQLDMYVSNPLRDNPLLQLLMRQAELDIDSHRLRVDIGWGEQKIDEMILARLGPIGVV